MTNEIVDSVTEQPIAIDEIPLPPTFDPNQERQILALKNGKIQVKSPKARALRPVANSYLAVGKYPDMQRIVDLGLYDPASQSVNHSAVLDIKEPVEIHCAIRLFEDFEVLLSLVAALKRQGYWISNVAFIYLMGMRSDRPFSSGGLDYFKEVIAPMIGLLDVPYVQIFAPHSRKLIGYDIKRQYCSDYWPLVVPKNNSSDTQKVFGIYGDQSSGKSIGGLLYLSPFELQNYNEVDSAEHTILPFNAIPHFVKRRDEQEKKIVVNLNDAIKPAFLEKLAAYPEQPLMIMDDLCDGGATFVHEAHLLRSFGVTNPLYLFVIHGLFTSGIDVLLKEFDHIVCTNSFQTIDHPKVTCIDVI